MNRRGVEEQIRASIREITDKIEELRRQFSASDRLHRRLAAEPRSPESERGWRRERYSFLSSR